MMMNRGIMIGRCVLVKMTNSLDVLRVRVWGTPFSRTRAPGKLAGVRANWLVAVRLEAPSRAFARCSASATFRPCAPACPLCDAQGDDELLSRLGALEILPVFPAFDVVVVRGILEVRVNLGTLEGLGGFDALGACSALGFGANLGACWRTDLRGFGLKAGEPDAGRVRLLGSGLLVESVTYAGPFLSGNM